MGCARCSNTGSTGYKETWGPYGIDRQEFVCPDCDGTGALTDERREYLQSLADANKQ